MNFQKVRHILAELRDTVDNLGDQPVDPSEHKGSKKRSRVWKDATDLLARFLMGFTMIPKNVMDDPAAFWSVDAVDCSTAYTGLPM